MARRIDIIDLLLKKGLVNQEQVSKAKEEVKRTGFTIEKAFEKLGFITEEDIANACAEAYGVPYMDLKNYIIDANLMKLIPENIAKKYKVVPVLKIGNNLTVAMLDPQDIVALDQIRAVSKMDNIELVVATQDSIDKVIDSYYGVVGSVGEIAKSIDKEMASKANKQDDRTLEEIAEEAPIIKLVNIMIMQAAKDRASDVHIEPEEGMLRVRYRIDGVLHEVNTLSKSLHRAVVSRVKILAKMDIAENRKPQDGRIRLKLEDKDLDIRVSTFPTVHGENVVMRLLDKSSLFLDMMGLGFSKNVLADFKKLINRPDGIILVTGPTGSGKTTTLYAALSTINSMEKNIITIEDPVEYEIPLIRQTPVNAKAGITFANGLRSILRQDPDVIMVGEIRDKETADMAIQASLTGHLVLSTLHTNDSASAFTRLIDMGIEPFLISSSVIGVLAQRLVRKICDKCSEKYTPSPEALKEAGAKAGTEFYRVKGCDKCKNTGFSGRAGIFELLVSGDEIKKMIDAKISADQIKKKAIELGMKTLKEDGLEKIKSGVTTVDEVLRVTEVEV